MPTPTPSPSLRTITTLSFTSCPSPVASPKQIDVKGTLTPAHAGASVTVTFSRPGSTPVAFVVVTDAGGNWSATLPEPVAAGTWSVDASYAGDSVYAASSAPTCSVTEL